MMFEALIARAERLARRRARARSDDLAGRIADLLPRGVQVEADADGVRLSGKRLRRRVALEPALRWMIAGLLR